ncbi:MAG: asparagine synthetase A [Nitrososphaeria archaeon]
MVGMRVQTKSVDNSSLADVPKPLEMLSSEELERRLHIGKVTTAALAYLTEGLVKEGFDWLLPVIFSKSTDPLWPDPGASIEKRVEAEIYGETVKTTLSMIVHKIVACSLAYPMLFSLSPNVRIEKRERLSTGWHVYEFTQLDFEVRYATSGDIRRLTERLLSGLMGYLKDRAKDDLEFLNRCEGLQIPETPLKVYDTKELEEELGEDWELKLAAKIDAPVWVTNLPREFYDYEDFEEGKWDNYDLILPRYGEVMSGSRREYEYGKIVAKMERDGVRKENYRLLLKLAREGKIKPSAGAGIGIERLICWIVGAKHVGEVQPFPKLPGLVYDL